MALHKTQGDGARVAVWWLHELKCGTAWHTQCVCARVAVWWLQELKCGTAWHTQCMGARVTNVGARVVDVGARVTDVGARVVGVGARVSVWHCVAYNVWVQGLHHVYLKTLFLIFP